MNDFIYKTWFIYKMLCVGDGRKKTWNEKNPRLVALPSPFYDMEADCFSVSENAEKQVGGGADLMGKKEKTRSGAVSTGRMNLFRLGYKIFRRGGLE